MRRHASAGLLLVALATAGGLAASAWPSGPMLALAASAGFAAAALFVGGRQAEAALEGRSRLERLASLGTMSAVMAHEIKNPLAALKGHAQLLAEDLPAGPPRERADKVVEAAVRLEELIASLLDFVKGGPVNPITVDPAQVLRRAVDDAAPGAQLDVTAAPPSWVLDPLRMKQAFENLLRNAAQASGGAAGVSASAALEGGKLVFRVADSGPGLPPGAPDKVFEPYFTTKARGTGLGLAVVRRVVELHRGTIAAENRAQGGALFTLVLPRG